ncbi:retrotransposon protein, putative, ty1-copia subclass [Tanacetum coccineum]
MESRNASFFEHIFHCLSKETGSSARLDDEVVQDKRQRDDNELQDKRQDQTEEEVEPRRSKRARNEKSFGPDFVSFMVENEPTSYRETIFKKKMKANGTIDKYKARLVIKGFRQREVLDYFDTYSPVTRITSTRMILAIAALRNLEVHQIDVKTAFLNRDLEEEIYMNQPEGFIAPGQEGKDISNGYVILCLYVDDMLIVDSNDKMIKSTKDMLKSKFDMKDMGLADVILGIKIIRTQKRRNGYVNLHIRHRHNSIRQLLLTGVISIDYVASKDNIADPFTKGLSRELVSPKLVLVASKGIVGGTIPKEALAREQVVLLSMSWLRTMRTDKVEPVYVQNRVELLSLNEILVSKKESWNGGENGLIDIPITSVFGSVDSENKVMDHSSEPLALILDHMARTTSTISFCNVSAAMNFLFVHRIVGDMKWKA